MFNRVLIANRGAIANRITRTLRAAGVEVIAVYHDKDRGSLHVQHADIAVSLGDGTVGDTYLNQEKIIAAALAHGADAIHPGYGFLSENPSFVGACEQHGIAFIGPTAEQMKLFGLKHRAREAAIEAGVPLVPGSPTLLSQEDAITWANKIGFPVMLKSSAGGGGIGMQVCRDTDSLRSAWESVRRLSSNYFSDDTVFLEKYVENARHIEVQVFGDGEGEAIAVGERDCSAQRRNQKVIEECPAPNLADDIRATMHATASTLMASVSYRNAGTVEFIFDVQAQEFYFLEVNTRLQVEHGVTEAVFGVDLVEWMLALAAGELPPLSNLAAALQPTGHAIQVRVYAEDTLQDFQPSAGLLSQVSFPETDGLRIDTWIESGIDVPALFDPMLAKIILHQPDRDAALQGLVRVLHEVRLYGIETNVAYVASVLETGQARRGELLTRSLASHSFTQPTMRVLSAGTQTTVQDFPGRQGYWHVGVPPSGPMDALSFRYANQLVSNDMNAAGLEMTLQGPSLRFTRDAVIAVTGADMQPRLDDQPLPRYQSVNIVAGQTLSFGKVTGQGARAYLAIAGGIQCPTYLGSRSTFTLGQFGGHAGRALRAGDVLHLHDAQHAEPRSMPIPATPEVVDLRVMYGPHGAPEFFTESDIETFFAAEWQVHYNSSRTGVRLIGPRPEWARTTGGEAGLHPSNIHDNAYAFGTVDFTGDMPVILGPDGPSLGGFVCPATVIAADLWKLGQLAAGQRVRFTPVDFDTAVAAEEAVNTAVSQLAVIPGSLGYEHESPSTTALSHPVINTLQWGEDALVCRAAGDHFLLLEIGPPELDLALRFKVHALMQALADTALPGVRELTPGIRSLQIHYDSQVIRPQSLVDAVTAIVEALPTNELTVTSRIVHLPLSWDDEACHLAIEKYMSSVRADAPWCPSNLEFIRRMNGLTSIDDVKQIVFDASYLVMGLGDVYLGAPVAVPLDPRHRLVTTKYNPARTWTAENSVGIGGAYLCVYGMEGPGGYQFVGRTSQMWNRYGQTPEFSQPWLLRFFDQLRFHEVTADALKDIRERLPRGQVSLEIEDTTFSLADYRRFLAENAAEISAFQATREAAFAEELDRWTASGQLIYEVEDTAAAAPDDEPLPEGVTAIESAVSGSVWRLLVSIGDTVDAGQPLLILESMKMEIEITAPDAGRIEGLKITQGQEVQAGQCLIWLAGI